MYPIHLGTVKIQKLNPNLPPSILDTKASLRYIQFGGWWSPSHQESENVSGPGPVLGPGPGPGPVPVPEPVIAGPDDWSRSQSFLVPMVGPGPGPIWNLVPVPVPVPILVPWLGYWNIHMNKYAIHAYTHGPVTGSGPGWPWSGFSAPV